MRRIAVLAGLALMLAAPSAASADPPSAHAAAVCADHETQAEAQNAADTIDADGDGRYCESLPCPCAGATPIQPLVPQGTRTEAQSKPNRAAVRRAKLRATRWRRFSRSVWRVTGVVDGDTVHVAKVSGPAPGTAWTVRLIGIDTPETVKPGSPVECGGPEATSALLERAFTAPVDTNLDGLYDTPGGEGRRVRLRTDVTQDLYDARGRVLAYVDTLTGLDLGRDQIEHGWSDVYVYDDEFGRHADYVEMADAASGRGEGAWSACAGDFHEALDLP